MVVTDTLPRAATSGSPKVTALTVAPLLGEAIIRIYEGRSVGAMFNGG
jgi:ribose-phosphate pyrophosphokinase